jgi:hypothetical protein
MPAGLRARSRVMSEAPMDQVTGGDVRVLRPPAVCSPRPPCACRCVQPSQPAMDVCRRDAGVSDQRCSLGRCSFLIAKARLLPLLTLRLQVSWRGVACLRQSTLPPRCRAELPEPRAAPPFSMSDRMEVGEVERSGVLDCGWPRDTGCPQSRTAADHSCQDHMARMTGSAASGSRQQRPVCPPQSAAADGIVECIVR